MPETIDKPKDERSGSTVCSSSGGKMRPSRRAFMQTMLVPVIASAVPAITVPEMHFHSIYVDGPVAEFWWDGCEDGKAWMTEPGYTREEALAHVMRRLIKSVSRCCDLQDYCDKNGYASASEFEVGYVNGVAESKVIEAAKSWDVGFDDAAKRLMGWACEGDKECEACGRYEMDSAVPTCDECYRCKVCVNDGVEWWPSYPECKQTGPCPHCHWA